MIGDENIGEQRRTVIAVLRLPVQLQDPRLHFLRVASVRTSATQPVDKIGVSLEPKPLQEAKHMPPTQRKTFCGFAGRQMTLGYFLHDGGIVAFSLTHHQNVGHGDSFPGTSNMPPGDISIESKE